VLLFNLDPASPETSKIRVVSEDGVEGNLTAGEIGLVPPREDDPVIAITVTPKLNQDGAKKYEMLIDPPLQYLIYRPTALVYGNIATATHGETRNEPLGNGDGRVAFPRFTLRSKPLTYLATGSANGVDPALKVTVNDIEWHRTDTLYAANPNDRSFVLRPQLDGTSVVEFGDGISGSRLPTGIENVRATYRSGGGAVGRVRAEQLKILLNKPLGLKAAVNPAASNGGTDGEAPDAIRHNAPAFTRSLRRIVSLEDLEDFARRFPGVGKAQVDLLWNGNRQVAHLTVSAPTMNAFDLTKLSAAIDDARDPHFPVVIQLGRILRFALKVEVLVKPDYDKVKVLAAVSQSLFDTFSFERRAFSEAVTTSEVAAAAHAVAGVLSVRATDLRSVFAAGAVEDPLRALPARYESGMLKPADLYLIEPTMLTTEEHRDV
jgi:predicted phage baseplate assembly protein